MECISVVIRISGEDFIVHEDTFALVQACLARASSDEWRDSITDGTVDIQCVERQHHGVTMRTLQLSRLEKHRPASD